MMASYPRKIHFHLEICQDHLVSLALLYILQDKEPGVSLCQNQ